MTAKYPRLPRQGVRTIAIGDRLHKVRAADFPDPTATGFLDRLPDQLKGSEWKEFCGLLAGAFREKKSVILMLGGHVVKVGCSPFLIDWIEKGRVSAVAFNGATAIHDVEIAVWGQTSEDVAQGLADGSFGMVEETPALFARALAIAGERDLGLGQALGLALAERDVPHAGISLVCACHRKEVPLTVHVALGTDTIHQHPVIDGAALGAASLADFEVLAAAVAKLEMGSVVVNFGSAVVLPEVFLKALTLARNLGHPADGLVAADFSMIPQYRPAVNVVGRPTLTGGGRGFSFVGYHELLIPLLHACVEEILEEPQVQV
ncbi:MAG: hypothetical protein V1794_13370 [Candidatus Glassbacteria bacterium]